MDGVYSGKQYSNPIDENIYQFDRELASLTISNNISARRSVPNEDLNNVDVVSGEAADPTKEIVRKCMAEVFLKQIYLLR